MFLRFYLDPETEQPHCYDHGITEAEVEEVMAHPAETHLGRDGALIALGQTYTGRYLRVIYVPDDDEDSFFVITAYELRGKPLQAFRRRQRRRRR